MIRLEADHDLISSFLSVTQRILLTAKKRGGRSLRRPISLGRTTYFRLVIAVRSAENFTMPAAPHQLEPKPPGLIWVKLPSNLAV
jgi:hypothetical protein